MSFGELNPVNTYPNLAQQQIYTAPYTAMQQPVQQAGQGAVAITTPQGRQIYNYPQTSVFNEPNKQQGLNIYVFNPSAIGAPSTYNNYGAPQNSPLGANPIANTSIYSDKSIETNEKKSTKTKKVVKLTNDYIKTLESFLRNPDKSVRKQGVADLVKRFDEDDTRFDNPSLTALLNIALQDPDVQNRMLALSAVTSGIAHGDENTVELLNNLSASDKLYGQEAKMATKALLKSSQTKETIIDNSPEQDKPKENNNEN